MIEKETRSGRPWEKSRHPLGKALYNAASRYGFVSQSSLAEALGFSNNQPVHKWYRARKNGLTMNEEETAGLTEAIAQTLEQNTEALSKSRGSSAPSRLLELKEDLRGGPGNQSLNKLLLSFSGAIIFSVHG